MASGRITRIRPRTFGRQEKPYTTFFRDIVTIILSVCVAYQQIIRIFMCRPSVAITNNFNPWTHNIFSTHLPLKYWHLRRTMRHPLILELLKNALDFPTYLKRYFSFQGIKCNSISFRWPNFIWNEPFYQNHPHFCLGHLCQKITVAPPL